MKIEFNRHAKDFRGSFTIEFNVKNPVLPEILEEDLAYEWETGHFTNNHSHECFEKIKKVLRSKRWSIRDWSFAGRSNGWWVLECIGDESAVTQVQLSKIDDIVTHYFNEYGKGLAESYPIRKWIEEASE